MLRWWEGTGGACPLLVGPGWRCFSAIFCTTHSSQAGTATCQLEALVGTLAWPCWSTQPSWSPPGSPPVPAPTLLAVLASECCWALRCVVCSVGWGRAMRCAVLGWAGLGWAPAAPQPLQAVGARSPAPECCACTGRCSPIAVICCCSTAGWQAKFAHISLGVSESHSAAQKAGSTGVLLHRTPHLHSKWLGSIP
jgi:hypothetical protein